MHLYRYSHYIPTIRLIKFASLSVKGVSQALSLPVFPYPNSRNQAHKQSQTSPCFTIYFPAVLETRYSRRLGLLEFSIINAGRFVACPSFTLTYERVRYQAIKSSVCIISFIFIFSFIRLNKYSFLQKIHSFFIILFDSFILSNKSCSFI